MYTKMNLPPSVAKLTLEMRLMKFYPEKYLPKYVTTVKDIYEYRSPLKLLPCSNDTLRYLLNIITTAIHERKRFRQFDCLKVIRAIVRNGEEQEGLPHLDDDVVRHLFFLYQEYVLVPNEEIQWCISRILRGQILDDDEVRWLILNYKKSSHIVNRLLRYPVRNELIAEWAAEVYKTAELSDRVSEIVALLIDKDVPAMARKQNNSVILWAIYYSHATPADKERLLLRHARVEDLDVVLDITDKLGSPFLIEHIMESLAQAS